MAHPELLAMIGWQELLLILIIVALIFGGSRLPQLGRGLGEFLKNLKSGMREGAKDEDQGDGGTGSGE